jgi:hypothetical protein
LKRLRATSKWSESSKYTPGKRNHLPCNGAPLCGAATQNKSATLPVFLKKIKTKIAARNKNRRFLA